MAHDFGFYFNMYPEVVEYMCIRGNCELQVIWVSGEADKSLTQWIVYTCTLYYFLSSEYCHTVMTNEYSDDR